MAAINVRLPDEKHERLKELAKSKNISVNKLMEELATIALTEYDAETRFKLRANRGSLERGLELLNKLQEHYGDE
ncbi:MAG: toxin-antitoxin system HicB family antitoxin [Cyanobacteria bacterium J06600_6]